MRTICLYFEIHQIIHLKRYRFFDIGTDHYYYDDYANETGMNEVAERSYIPALSTLIEMVKNSGGAFKVALSISGVALEQLEIHAPAVIDLLHQLNDTGCCEFLCEPYSHGLSSLANEDCFREEVLRQRDKMKQMFLLSGSTANHDRDMIRRTSGRTQRLDLLYEEGNQCTRIQDRFCLLV